MSLRKSFACVVLIAFISVVNAEDLVWTPETTLKVKSISDVDVSPDGKEVLYLVTEAKVDKNTYISQVWKGKVDDPNLHVPFTSDKYSSASPRWSPDGRWIAFLSKRPSVKNLYLISPEGGEAIQITDLKKDIETFRWSPDSSMIAFIAKQEDQSLAKDKLNLSEEVDKYSKKEEGSQLFVIKALPNLQTPEVLTTRDYYVVGEIDFHTILEAFDWSPDNKKIAFTYTPEAGQDSRWKNSQIAIVDIHSKEIEKLNTIAPHQSIPRYSPNGKFIAFLKSEPEASYCLTRTITLFDLSNGQLNELQKTPDESPFLVGPSLLGWTSDSSALLYLEPLQTKFAIWKIPVNGGDIARLDDGNWTFSNPLLSRNSKWFGIPLETSKDAPEAYVSSTLNYSPKKISHVNEHLKSWKIPETKVVHWKSQDGTEIEGLLTYPKDYKRGTRYPFLLVVHGGPMGAFFETFLGGMSVYPLGAFADAGFVILRPNPRGSCGYGRDFRYAARSDWGGKDYQDLMSGVDQLIEQGIIDPNRMGVMGWSYGGYMTAWIVGQTDRFSAASMGAGISNLISFTGTSDIHHFISDYLEGEVWEKYPLYLQRSPILYTNRVSTPLMIQHGTEDLRVPFSQAVEFYNELHKANKPVAFAVYPRSTHRISEPKLQLDSLQRNFDWFVEKVKNKDKS